MRRRLSSPQRGCGAVRLAVCGLVQSGPARSDGGGRVFHEYRQRHAEDFQALVDKGQAPQFTYLWLPGDHTGGCDSPPVTCGPHQEVVDNDKAVGQVLDYLTHSPICRHTAVFMTEDDGQSSPDHVSPHRIFTIVISPYAKHQKVVHQLSSTVSIPKTIEEILNLPAMGYGDLVANDLLRYFTTKPSNDQNLWMVLGLVT